MSCLREVVYYLFFISATIAMSVSSAYFSAHSSNANGFSHYFFLTWFVGAIPVWAMAAVYSKDLVFDGLVFDLLVLVFFFLGLMVFSKESYEMKPIQVFFLVLMLLGGIGYKLSE